MPYADYQTLSVQLDAGIATVTFDHPPINLMDAAMLRDLARLGQELAEDREVRVAVFRSANPEFFIAHADVSLIQQLPTDALPANEPSGFHAIVERLRTLPFPTLAAVEGIARGGGSELLLSLDMRFAALGRARFSQPEVALGILPGGSGTQRLPRLLGRGRALEAVLGCDDFDAATAERYGWVNRALPPEELGPFVDGLARRIASFPPEAVALAKACVDSAELPLRDGLAQESDRFDRTLRTDAARDRMARFLEHGGQTREVEVSLQDLVEKL